MYRQLKAGSVNILDIVIDAGVFHFVFALKYEFSEQGKCKYSCKYLNRIEKKLLLRDEHGQRGESAGRRQVHAESVQEYQHYNSSEQRG